MPVYKYTGQANQLHVRDRAFPKDVKVVTESYYYNKDLELISEEPSPETLNVLHSDTLPVETINSLANYSAILIINSTNSIINVLLNDKSSFIVDAGRDWKIYPKNRIDRLSVTGTGDGIIRIIGLNEVDIEGVSEQTGFDINEDITKSGSYVWNAGTSKWERMTQPLLNTDEVNVDVDLGPTEVLLSALKSRLSILNAPPDGKNITKISFWEDAEGNTKYIKYYSNDDNIYSLTFSDAGASNQETYNITRS